MKTHTLTQTELEQLNQTLEQAEHGLCLVVTLITLLVNSEGFHSMGRPLQIGLHEGLTELEQRFNRLEKLVEQLNEPSPTAC